MTAMTQSRPLFLIVITISLLLVAIVVFWLAAMPQQMLGGLKRSLADQSGFMLEATKPQLSFHDGIALRLENVSLSNDSTTSLSARSMEVKTPFATLFGGGFKADDIVLDAAVVTLDVSSASRLPKFLHGRIELRESSLRLRDGGGKGVVSLSDVSGMLAVLQDGRFKADLNFLLADRLTTFAAEAESAERLFSTGSPADITVSAPKMLAGFSGQAKLGKGVELAGQSNIEAEDAAALFRWLGMPLSVLEGMGRFAFLGGVATQGLTVEFDKFNATLGDAILSGQSSVSVGLDLINLSGDIEVSKLSMLPAALMLAQPWSQKSFSFLDFHAVNLDLRLKTNQLQLRGRDFGPVRFAVKTEPDRTLINLPRQAMAGGTAEATFSIGTVNDSLNVSAKINTAAVEAKAFLGGIIGLDAMQGPLDVIADLKLQGNSMAALVSSISGSLAFSAQTENAVTADLAKMLTHEGEGWLFVPEPTTQKLALDAKAKLQDGVATFERFTLKVDATTLKPRGEIDILRQVLDLQLSPKLSLTGIWTKPVVSSKPALTKRAAVTPPAN